MTALVLVITQLRNLDLFQWRTQYFETYKLCSYLCHVFHLVRDYLKFSQYYYLQIGQPTMHFFLEYKIDFYRFYQ